MDTIITILVIVLAMVFKVVEKKLKNAGNQKSADRMKELAEIFGADQEVFPTVQPMPAAEPQPVTSEERREEFSEEPLRPVEPIKIKEPHAAPQKVQKKVQKKDKKAPILLEEEPKKRTKIDPKKLVVYSEIMKPKYLE